MPLLPILAFLRFVYTLIKSVWNELRNPDNPEFRGLLSLVLIILVTGTFFYHWVEGWDLLDSLYFSVVTLTTIGYGDLSPKTAFGKVFTIVYIIVGLGTLAGFINVLAKHTLRAQSARGSKLKPSEASEKKETA